MEPPTLKTKYNSAQYFVNNLLSEGAEVTCDDLCVNFNNRDNLPPFYDEKLFKSGQKFFYKYMFSLFFSKYLGLMAALAVPSILKILIFTKQSSSEVTSYRRYAATILHMLIWYDSDFKPGSKLWRSISEVRNLHNSASNKSCAAGMQRITQKDMAIGQFGFFGISLIRSEMVGIYNASDDEWRAFLHLWRVVGYLVGIEDRFNLCNGSLEETRERCNILMEQVFRPNIDRKDEDFLNMSRYMVHGLWSINMYLKFETIIYYLHVLSQDEDNNKKFGSTCYKLNPSQKYNLNFLVATLQLLSWNWFRILQNYCQMFSLWLVKVFPLLAVFQFGISKARVRVLTNYKTN